jgi:hypothetical protein
MTTVKQATVSRAIGENDVVELVDPTSKSKETGAGTWPAGTIGAVVSDHGDVKLIEIADEQGVMLDLILVREARLKLVAKHS